MAIIDYKIYKDESWYPAFVAEIIDTYTYKGNEFPCHLCGETMDDEDGEVHWLCGVIENAQADYQERMEEYYAGRL